jgi:hypothetical protein
VTDNKLVKHVTSYNMPKEGEPGQLVRIVADIDVTAIRDYVLYGNGARDWPLVVIDEMLYEIREIAAREQFSIDLGERMNKRIDERRNGK